MFRYSGKQANRVNRVKERTKGKKEGREKKRRESGMLVMNYF